MMKTKLMSEYLKNALDLTPIINKEIEEKYGIN